MYIFSRVFLTCFHVWKGLLLYFIVFYHRKVSAIIRFSYLPWSSRSFDIDELISAPFFFKIVSNYGFGYTKSFYNLSDRFILFFFSLMIASFTCIWLHIKSSSPTAAKYKFNSFFCFICLDLMREWTMPGHEPARLQSIIKIS